MRVLFFGTPQFAADVLGIVLGGAHQVVGLVSQPSRRSGRGLELRDPPAVVTAREAGLPILQPVKLHGAESLEQLRGLRPDVILTAAFGRILKPRILDLPPKGCWNVHASLLPRHRGASPVTAAIEAGDTWTGVTIFRMDPGLDTGPMLAQEMTAIRPEETGGGLTDRLARMGGRLALEALDLEQAGRLATVPQPEEGATYAPLLKKEDGRVDWSTPVDVIERKVRALTPWPGAFTFLDGRRLRIHRAQPAHRMPVPHLPPGSLLELPEGIGVVCHPGLLALMEIQVEGKKRQSSQEWARGQRDWQGRRLDA